MKLPTLTAIALIAAVAAPPAIAADTPPENASGTASVVTKDNNANVGATTATTPSANPVTVTTTTPMTTPAGPATAMTNANLGTATVNTGRDKDSNANANALPHQRNPVLADNGQPRAGKVIGSDVYNMQDKQIGSVDDILMGVGGQPDQAVISVKGKLVLVPFNKLIFGNTQISGDNRVILPDETKDALGTLPEFHYNAQNKG
jgi:hypothetical protein